MSTKKNKWEHRIGQLEASCNSYKMKSIEAQADRKAVYQNVERIKEYITMRKEVLACMTHRSRVIKPEILLSKIATYEEVEALFMNLYRDKSEALEKECKK